jgi:hypothetical protein
MHNNNQVMSSSVAMKWPLNGGEGSADLIVTDPNNQRGVGNRKIHQQAISGGSVSMRNNL